MTAPTCPICEMTYATDEKDVEHLRHHHKFLACALALGYYPEQYEAREARKRFGNELVHDKSRELNDRVFGALQTMRAWFDRSLDAAIDNEYWSEHPTFEKFCGMVSHDAFPGEVQTVIDRRFGSNAGELDEGSYWRPKKPPGRANSE